MKKNIIILSVLMSLISFSNIKDHRPDFKNIDRYKKFKEVAAGLQEFNYITPSYSYNKIGEHNVDINWGIFNYNYNKSTEHTFSIKKNLSDIIDNKFMVDYYLKIEEFYNLKDKNIKEYKDTINIYYDYLLKKIELENEKEVLNNINNNINIAKVQYNLGKISNFDYESALLKSEYAKLNINKLNLELLSKEKELKMYKLDKNEIKYDDIFLYKIISPNLLKYINYQNEKVKNANQLKKYTNLKNDIDVFLPTINVNYDLNIKNNNNAKPIYNHNYGFSISKTIWIADRHYIDNKLEKDDKVMPLFDIDIESKQYKILINILNMQEKKYELTKKDLEINKLKLKLGKITNLKYLEKLEELSNEKLELIKAQINLTKYILERE